ncbi:MAG TPA: hypothetical protein VFC19_38765 [Candidatus Limnocylindrales bacterium]|nr:hypothetical protein [Candidatus Limnocylindrales bacterium]
MNRRDMTAAARLLRYAVTVSLRPTSGSEYRALLDRYRTDVEFAEGVVAIADGWGLDVRAATPLGLIVTGDGDSPFRITLDNSGLPLRASPAAAKLQDRLLFGLVLVAVAAYAYPAGESLTETTTPTVRPAELNRFITRKADALRELAKAERVDEIDAQLGEAARMWLELPEILPVERGSGLRKECQRRYVNDVLNWLVEAGRARREAAMSDERGQAYTLNDRFRIGLAETADTLAYGILATDTADDSVREGA